MIYIDEFLYLVLIAIYIVGIILSTCMIECKRDEGESMLSHMTHHLMYLGSWFFLAFILIRHRNNNAVNHKEDEERQRFLFFFKKTVLRIRDGKENPIYLIRYSLFTCPWFSVKLHKIMLSDDDCMHDHPWSFLSIILKGGYVEHTPNGKKLYGAGSILWRPAPSVHKLEVFQPATTLVVTFKRKRDWGFITPSGWVIWWKYIRSGQKCE